MDLFRVQLEQKESKRKKEIKKGKWERGGGKKREWEGGKKGGRRRRNELENSEQSFDVQKLQLTF